MPGPLVGMRVVEMTAIGPVPFCGMLLSDMGADVIRIDRVSGGSPLGSLADVCSRGKRSVAVDVKRPEGRSVVLELAAGCDVLIEGFRPGVMERLGLGPDDVAAVNPRLVYGRMTGWGQEGPLATMAGHDINYIGLVGALHAIGGDAPEVPLNLIGDYGGGALYLAFGVVAAIYERQKSGVGQVIDAAMVDGAASLMTPTYQLAAAGAWHDRRRSNFLDGAAPFYRVYETADGRHMAVGALEPQFYARLLELLELDSEMLPAQYDRTGWPELTARFAAVFATQPRSHWESLFSNEDACVTPVLSLDEAPGHAHNQYRHAFAFDGARAEPAPAPRFSRTPGQAAATKASPGRETAEVLAEFGIGADQVAELASAGVLGSGAP